jgi:hypothetical protein
LRTSIKTEEKRHKDFGEVKEGKEMDSNNQAKNV